jgi:hypothetical protein
MAFRKVAEFKECSLQYQSNSTATFQWTTDMPGGTLAPRLAPAVNLPSTGSTRKTTTVPLDGIFGTEYVCQVTPSATCQMSLYSAVVYIRPIGVYIDGSLGEIWSTPPISVGT